MYRKKYLTNNSIEIDGFDEPVRLPDRPPIELFRNYGKPQHEQKFEVEPRLNLDKATDREVNSYVDKMWNMRINGDWWLINGHEVYIPGYAWFFFNAWTAEINDNLPEFRMEAVEFFLVAEHIIDSKFDLGLLIVKPRRIGETEKILCLGYDMCTRYRQSRFGMQNIIENDARDNFLRVVAAHRKMMFCFKPQHRGGDDIKTELEMRIAGKNESERKFSDTANSLSLGSRIDYKPTVYKAYDGKRLRFYHLDEYGKIPDTSMPILKQWAIVKECLAVKGGTQVLGKAFFSTTVEDIKDGQTIANVESLWADSDPNKKTANSKTLSGLKRYFRSYELLAQVDEFGFHKREEMRKQITSEIAMMEAEKKWSLAVNYRRKFPSCIEDSLAVASTEAVFESAFVESQLAKIRIAETGQEQPIIKAEKYILRWSGLPFQSDVVAIPSETGKFHISLLPVIPNAKTYDNGRYKPGAIGTYTGGIDGFDHKEGVSDGGFSIFAPFNPLYEDHDNLVMGDDGKTEVVDKGKMRTNRFVLTYRDRPSNPDEFYMDTAMALFFYGCQALPEQDKPGVMRFYERNSIYDYLAWKPKGTGIGVQSKREKGVKATTQFISLWQDGLQAHFAEYPETYGHKNQLLEYKVFNGKNRTKLDILVSAGYAYQLAQKYVLGERRKLNNNRWGSIPA